jgi:hypothetical protein
MWEACSRSGCASSAERVCSPLVLCISCQRVQHRIGALCCSHAVARHFVVTEQPVGGECLPRVAAITKATG